VQSCLSHQQWQHVIKKEKRKKKRRGGGGRREKGGKKGREKKEGKEGGRKKITEKLNQILIFFPMITCSFNIKIVYFQLL
jgi:hypothetical protein